jgi:hypothetical protein
MKLLMPAALLIGSTLIAAALYVGPGGSSLQHKVSDNLCEDLSKAAAYEASKIAMAVKATDNRHEALWKSQLLDFIREKETKGPPPTMEFLQFLLENPRENASVWDGLYEIKSDEVFKKLELLRSAKPVDIKVLENLKEIGIVRSYYCK